ncbi:unnamed protein product, partial [Dibothriocephalus latus]
MAKGPGYPVVPAEANEEEEEEAAVATELPSPAPMEGVVEAGLAGAAIQ